MSRRSGFTLLELITAMLASTVLVASLAATVVISTRLLETPPSDETVWHDRYLADRLASDLRYATSVQNDVGNGFQIIKPDPIDGSQQTVTYEAYIDGLTRQVDSGPVTNLDAVAPASQFVVDGYSAPTYTSPDTYVRVRSSSTAATPATAASLDVDVPPGCKTGDLVLLCVSAKTPSSLGVSESGWQSLQLGSADDLRLFTFYRFYDTSWSPTITVSVSPDAAVAAAMVAIENVHPSSPIDWTGARAGYAFSFLPFLHPTPLESSGFNPRQLNVQIFAADFDPWYAGSLGLPGFVDAARTTASPGNAAFRNSIAITVRNGATPEFETTPRLLHRTSGFWFQAAARLEVAP